ncbi:helix-turn-helix domain-containing protein [Streptomyces sp. VRA16 Mangrove soil]|uniref:helix-turn-helix domain-containing protein n=1 Tax=Streptomyces sp. VRA16 Mangrove soil TaxID=2817434 RepID=UPI001A9D104C|nr:helix-turn-helix transcriptional regulator [Streptomyces sp. VRA16 Mangrove soil]MBO1335337.1 helix-turn-helix domain-containing protein [Streptomyces sp. VRA16 Mangrove soil]
MADNELGTFLRTRREAVTPAEVGLPTGPRRRTPGLRRAELATLAGISAEYLTRLEQGRDRNPSPSVIGALADVLRLSTDERLLLRRLAKAGGADAVLCSTGAAPSQTVRPTVHALLRRLEPTPAIVVNWVGDVLAHTDGYARFAKALGILDVDRPNLVRYLFTDERARRVYPEWDRVADDQIARLRQGAPLVDSLVASLVDELTVTAGAPFTDRMAAAAAPPRRAGHYLVAHPDVGPLRLAMETLALPDGDGQSILVHLPADDVTAAALDRLNGRTPGALRAVSG